MTQFQMWLLATRPKTLPAAVAPIVLGTALAYSQNKLHATAAILALLISFCMQIGVNLANDYFDGIAGLDDGQRFGPLRATASGMISARNIKQGMIFCFLLATILSIPLFLRAGGFVILIGIFSVLAALAYSGGPFPLASNGLGDIFSFLFFGPVAVCGTYFVQSLDLPFSVFLLSIPTGLLIAAILIVNNYRDLEMDKLNGKNTLAVILGAKASKIQFFLLIVSSYLLLIFFWQNNTLPFKAIVPPFFTLPLAKIVCRSLYQDSETVLNSTLAKTAVLALAFSLLLATGIIFWGATL